MLIALPSATSAGVKGDLNDDGIVDSADAMLLLRVVHGDLDPGTLDPEDVADVAPIIDGVGGDEEIDQADALLMLRCLKVDVDTDTLSTSSENQIGTSPFLADTDDDGHRDDDDPNPLETDPPANPDLRVEDGPSSIGLSWATPAGQVGSYLIHRYGTDGEYTFFTADSTAQSYTDSTAETGKVYFYWVQAVHPKGEQSEFVNCNISDPSNSKLWRTGSRGPLPNPHFTASEATSGSGARIDWDPITSVTVDEYRIYMSPTVVPLGSTGASFTLVHTQSGPTPSDKTMNLGPGTYYFRMTSRAGTTESNLASAQQRVVVVD